MPSSKFTYAQPSGAMSHVVREEHIEYGFIGKLQGLKYEYRADIRDRASLERNFREKFEALNRVKLSDSEFARLLDEIVTPDVFTAARTLRSINAFKARAQAELALMKELVPLLSKRAQGREISGLSAYE
jgi:type I restriction enzyme, R subunit